MKRVQRYTRMMAAVVGCLALLLAAQRAFANQSDAICDSDQLVTPSVVGLANQGGPDPNNPEHWEPIGDPGTAEGMRCETTGCTDPVGCRIKIVDATLGPLGQRTRVRDIFCACGTGEATGTGCKIILQHIQKESYNEQTEEMEWNTTQWRAVCSDDNNACTNTQCKFAVGAGNLADCDCN